MIEHLEWPSLEKRRKDARLAMLYKIEHDKVALTKEGRLMQPTWLSRNMHDKSSNSSNQKWLQEILIFPRTTRDWNTLPPGVESAPSVEALTTSLTKLNKIIKLGDGGRGGGLYAHLIHGIIIISLIVVIIRQKQKQKHNLKRLRGRTKPIIPFYNHL